jgi:uncharacterized membrane protein YiaA
MKGVCWLLIMLGAVAFVVGAVLAFNGGRTWVLAPQGYWRGAMGFVLFAIALRLMEDKR